MKKYILSVIFTMILFLFTTLSVFNLERNKSSQEPRYGGVFRLKSFADRFNRQLDPASLESFIFISEQIYDGLVRLDKDFNIVPSLAEYWEISPDGKIYTFYLRKMIRFHHGEELTAEDVKFPLERLLDKDTNSPYYQFFIQKVVGATDYRDEKSEDVEGFKVLDKYTFEIHWIEPFVSALYLMSMHFCKILPQDLVLEKGRRFFSSPSGTGPFMYDYWIRDTRLNIVGVRLKRNEEYFLGRPYLKAVEFCPRFTLDHFLDREIDSIPVLSEKLLTLKYQVFQDGSLQSTFLGMSCHIPPLDNPAVRRALSFAINKREIARAAFDMKYVSQVTNNYIPSRLPGFFPLDDRVSFDLDKAKNILKRAGFLSEEEFPNLTLFMDEPRTRLKSKIYRAVRDQLEVLGIRLRARYCKSYEDIKIFETPYLILVRRVMNFPDPEDIVRPLFFSRSIFNVFNYRNPELDSLLHKAEVERSWTKRIKFFHEIEHILFLDVPAIPLFSQQNRVAMQPYVRGVEVPPLGFNYLDARKIWLDK